MQTTDGLVPPHGGELIDLVSAPQVLASLSSAATTWSSWTLTPRQSCDLELLVSGAFSPLRGFMTAGAHRSVCERMRLPNGLLWPIPVTLHVDDALAARVKAGDRLALRDEEGTLLAAMQVEDVWQVDVDLEASTVYGTTSEAHPGVAVLRRQGRWCMGGPIIGARRVEHFDFPALRKTPAETRDAFARLGWSRVVAFQTRNPIHRAHFELTRRAADEAQAKLLVHPVVGPTRDGDLDHYVRTRCYQHVMSRYPPGTAMLSLLPLAMRMAGPREAMLHAIVRRNHGCSHFIVGRDHAGPGVDASGTPFYKPYDAQEIVAQHASELGVTMVPFRNMVYVPDLGGYHPDDAVPAGRATLDLSGTELRRRLRAGEPVPEWFTFPDVARELAAAMPHAATRGVVVFMTGLSGSGKSTIAKALRERLLAAGRRAVTILDGDLVRRMLSSGLGFSREDRDTNVRRIGFVAAEIARHGGTAICAPIAPFDSVRQDVRQGVEAAGGTFVLVHVATAIEVCEQRDTKGLYAKARAGLVQQFTGVSDPYETPRDAEVVVDAGASTPAECVDAVMRHLSGAGAVAEVHARPAGA